MQAAGQGGGKNGGAGGYRLPLQLTLGALFVLLVVLVGGILSWQGYDRSSRIILESARQVQHQAAGEASRALQATYRPVAMALRILAWSPVTGAGSLDQRLASLPGFVAALRGAPAVSGIQVGYGDGDYFIVRRLDDPVLRQRFHAPADAAFVVDDIQAGDEGAPLLTRLFFGRDLKEVAREEPVTSDYDPRTRPWYRRAIASRPLATYPYRFRFIGEVGTTFTMRSGRPGVVVAADVTLRDLSASLSGQHVTPGTELALIGASGRVLAWSGGNPAAAPDAAGNGLPRLATLPSRVLADLGQALRFEPAEFNFESGRREWQVSIMPIGGDSGLTLFLLMASPLDELLGGAMEIRRQALTTTAVVALFAIPLVWLLARRLSLSMRRLAADAGKISRFDFSEPVDTRSFIAEVDQLALTMGMMKETINRFLTLINSLAGERDFGSLLGRIVAETLEVSRADAVVTYLLEGDVLKPGEMQIRGQGPAAVSGLGELDRDQAAAFLDARDRGVRGLVRVSCRGPAGLLPLLTLLEADLLNVILLPLYDRKQVLTGLLGLIYREREESDLRQRREQLAFVRAMSGFAAVSLESRQLLEMQEALLSSFIKLIAGAIDAKSPYTGGHCQRVPELTRMLARAAVDSREPPFQDFDMDPDQWEALEIASWLHDCGKVTTPEYVVDKATKLEGIHDRIHEIRMRFEVLKRDAVISYWQQLAAGGEAAPLQRALQEEWKRLDEEFAFVARCNQGGEFLAPEALERLQQIGERRWMRTLDDRLGISAEALRRRQRTPAAPLPVEERLLADKPEHLVEREGTDPAQAGNTWGFRMEVPEYKMNQGELYNLSVARGTLTPEERYIINHHIVQTIVMLEKLPYPRHLGEVPLIAGCHHETMDGQGYPRRLTREQMPLAARMVAIADIFEALTASDRPYKKAKRLSEALAIMGRMAEAGHIDPDLFRLFLDSDIPGEYGRRFLKPEQRDTAAAAPGR